MVKKKFYNATFDREVYTPQHLKKQNKTSVFMYDKKNNVFAHIV